YAPRPDMLSIEGYIKGSSDKGLKPEIILLGNLDAAPLAEKLNAMFGDVKSGAPYISAETSRNGIIVRGTPEQVEEVRKAIDIISESGTSAAGSTNARMISLDKGSAAALAEELARILKERGKGNVKVIIPGEEEKKPEEKKPEEKKPTPPPDKPNRTPDKETWNGPPPGLGGTLVARKIVDPRDNKDNKDKADKPNKEPEVTITVVGNKLLIQSDDPKILDYLQDVTRLMKEQAAAAGEGDFHAIRLKYANAV